MFKISRTKTSINRYRQSLFGDPSPAQAFDRFRRTVPLGAECQSYGVPGFTAKSGGLIYGSFLNPAASGQRREDQCPSCCSFLSGRMAMGQG